MRIKLLSGVGLGGGNFAYKDEIVTVDDHFARTLIHEGRAIEAPEEPPAPRITTPANPDPKPKRIR